MKKFLETERPEKQKFLTYFLLLFPSIIISAVPTEINGSIMQGLAIKVLILFLQFVIIKSFVDRYYGE